jgi:hypothetical protein
VLASPRESWAESKESGDEEGSPSLATLHDDELAERTGLESKDTAKESVSY